MFTVLKLGAVLLLIVAGLALTGTPAPAEVVALPPENLITVMGAALIPVLFAYGGWQHVNEVAAEVTRPQRTLPRALLLGIAVVVACYVLGQPGVSLGPGRTVAHPSERLALLALRRADELLAPTLALLADNQARVEAFVAGQPRLSWTPPPAGSVGLVQLAGGSVDELAARLEQEHRTAIAPGRFFGAPDHFRIGWALPAEILDAGLERLALALRAP